MIEKSLAKQSLQQLMQNMPQQGKVEWIGIRAEKRKALKELVRVFVTEKGLEGDHYAGRSGNRSVTLIQAEHIKAIASLLHRDEIDPLNLRRNIVVSGINLLALKDREFKIGTVILKMTGLCHPCSRMEEILGEGGYNAMRGHGGINARVISPGEIKRKDKVIIV
ncbi:FIG060329: MOSC domain protein [hydrothermal vent metagenome]|uniref:FIG060329: MOSC domain protein n=1 Tax=hydrothermal vent metagenome TaxID=652676 RepID=A0A3B0WH47_9ZZZZ